MITYARTRGLSYYQYRPQDNYLDYEKPSERAAQKIAGFNCDVTFFPFWVVLREMIGVLSSRLDRKSQQASMKLVHFYVNINNMIFILAAPEKRVTN